MKRLSVLTVTIAVLTALVFPLGDAARANHGDRTLEVNPETATRGAGSTHTLTASLCANPFPTPEPNGDEGQCTTAGPADNESGSINIDFENEAGVNDGDGNTPTTPDKTCTIASGASSCSISYVGFASGNDLWRVWIDHDGINSTTDTTDLAEGRNEQQSPGSNLSAGCPDSPGPFEPDCTDVVQVTWGTGGPASVDCDDQTGPDTEREVNPSGGGAASNETYTCTAYDQFGNPTQDADPGTDGNQQVTIYGEVENGVNDPDGGSQPGEPTQDPGEGASYDSPDYQCAVPTGTSGANGRCDSNDPMVVTQLENEVGTAEICFWVGSPAEGGDADHCGTEPTGEAQEPSGADSPNDAADQVEKTWEERTATIGGLDAEPETDTNTMGDQHSITATVYDQFGDPYQGFTTAYVEFFQGSPADAANENSDGNSPGTPDDQCTTNNSSSCSITYTQNLRPGRDMVCVWMIHNTPAMAGSNETATCNGEGHNDADDTAGAADPPQPTTDDVDVVAKVWRNASPATRLDCTPEGDQNPTRTSHTVVCTARNDGGDTQAGEEVDVEAMGANDPDAGNTPGSPDFTCVTGADGRCSFRHGPPGTPTNQSGTTRYRAWIDSDFDNSTANGDAAEGVNEAAQPGGGEPDGTDVVAKTWFPAGVRTISLRASNSSRPTGRPVTLSGRIRSRDNRCVSKEGVRLYARNAGSNNFVLLSSTKTGGNGRYSFKVIVNRTRDYRTVAPRHGVCKRAQSPIRRVRAT